MFFELEDAGTVLRFYREFIVDAPEEFGGFPAWQIAPPLPFIPEDRHGETFLAFVACWAGPTRGGRARPQAAPRRRAGGRRARRGDAVSGAQQRVRRARPARASSTTGRRTSSSELTDEAIAAHLEHGPKVPVVNSTVHIYPINGACHRVAADATAFAYRDANFATVIAGMWPDPAENEANTQWVRDYYEATAPLSEEGGYINFMAGDDQDRIRANYRGELRPPGRGQAEVRPGQPLPREPEHQALGSTASRPRRARPAARSPGAPRCAARRRGMPSPTPSSVSRLTRISAAPRPPRRSGRRRGRPAPP